MRVWVGVESYIVGVGSNSQKSSGSEQEWALLWNHVAITHIDVRLGCQLQYNVYEVENSQF